MATKRDYYEILGTKKGASDTEIKTAYRKMALKWHPDRNQDNKEEAERQFKEINEAYQVLSDPKKKQTYDQFGHAAFDPAGGGMGGNPFSGGFGGQNGPFTYTYRSQGQGGGQDFDFGDPFEIFEQFFGGGFGGFSQQARRPRYSLTIDFIDAITGTTKEVRIDNKKHTITIPPGANDGTRIRFDDFDVSINVATHPRFKRDEYDLYVDHQIPYSVAVSGGTTEVETVDQLLKLKIRPGTASHTLIRLRNEGVPHIRGGGKGDMYVRLIITVPEKLTAEQKKAVQQLHKAGL